MAGPPKNRRILEMTLGLLALAGTAAILPAAGPAATSVSADSASPAHTPSLEGTWTLNEDLTARMRETDQQHGDKRGAGGGFGHRGGGGRRGGGSGQPGEPGEPGEPPGGPNTEIVGENPAHEEETPRPSFAGLSELTISQQGRQVTITDKDGHARVLTTDGSKIKDAKAPGGPAEIQAKWEKDGTLIVQVRPAKGPRRTESYIVSNDRKHLYLVVDIDGEGTRPNLKIRRAYDPATPPEKPAAPGESSGEGDTELA
jgi:hypothetical protein